jgi:ferritin-like metal-binding protein YciE
MGQNTRNTDVSLLLVAHASAWLAAMRGAVMQVDSLETLYTACIAKLRNAEQQGLQAYDMMLQKARHPELRQALEQHRTETEQQIQRLEQIIQRSGGATMQVEDEIMPAIFRENQKMQSMIASDELSAVSLIAGAQIGEHYEIAAYGTAAAHAKLLGRQEDLQLLLQTLEEEKRTDELLTQIAERSVNQQAPA